MSKGFLIVLNKDEDTVHYIDPDTGRTEARLAVDRNPHEVIVSPDGRTAYVTNAGGNTLSVLDNRERREIGRLSHPEFQFPHGLDFSADGRTLYLVATYASKLFLISVPGHEFRRVIPTHQRHSHMIAVGPGRRVVYIPNIGSNSISVFDPEREEIVRHIPVGRGPEGVAAHPATGELFVANQHENDLWVVDPATGALLARDRLGTLPVRLVISPDGRHALVPNRESGDLSIVDCGKRREIKRIRVGLWPGGVVFRPDGAYAYVANNKTNDVSVIEMAGLREVGRLEAGVHPDGIGWVPAT